VNNNNLGRRKGKSVGAFLECCTGKKRFWLMTELFQWTTSLQDISEKTVEFKT